MNMEFLHFQFVFCLESQFLETQVINIFILEVTNVLQWVIPNKTVLPGFSCSYYECCVSVYSLLCVLACPQ